MPCNSAYLEADTYEQELSKVACLLDEIEGVPWRQEWWRGYHPDVYGKAKREHGDKLVSELCSKLQNCDVTRYSLEMQTWWRDHQQADKERETKHKPSNP